MISDIGNEVVALRASVEHWSKKCSELQAENAELRKDAAELWKALNDLSFHCDAVFVTAAPPRSIYNSTFTVMDSFRAKYSPAAMKGEK